MTLEETQNRPEPDIRTPKPVNGTAIPLRDGPIRAIMIPAFGIVIPYFSGYFGPIPLSSPRHWIGLAWSILIACAIWQGNRYFLLRQRLFYDWFQHPVRKICALLFANIFYTGPVAVVMMLGWYRFAGFGPDWAAIRTATLCCVICVIAITHVYETVFLIQERESDQVAFERMERARAEAKLAALKAQISPHFLFNSLNTLSWLIEHYPARALAFNQDLAEVYRYILVANRRDLVPLEEEFAFARQYFGLLELRFEDSLDLAFPELGELGQRWFLPPVSLQILLENAVKHNEHSPRRPLRLSMTFGPEQVVVSNEKRPMPQSRPAARAGLRWLDDRCRLALGRGIEVLDTADRFTVHVPVRSVPI